MGRQWALGERVLVPNLDHPERLYLTRWRIVQTPWFGVYLHRFDEPDSRPTLHDHPWPFLSFVLRGGYDEERLVPSTQVVERRMVGRWNFKRATDFHYITRLWQVPTWTLMFVGRRRREWGYAEHVTDDGYVWTRFDRHSCNDQYEAALAERSHRPKAGDRG